MIRISINRNNLFICVRPIPRGKINSFDMLYFLLDAATVGIREISILTSEQIPKTIVFINSIIKV